MLEKFDNHLPPEDERRPGWIRRWKSAVILALIVLAILVGAGAVFRDDSVIHTVRNISTATIASLRRHFAHGLSRKAVTDFLHEIRSGEMSSRRNIPETNTSAEYLYTVELADGGRVEGRIITVGEDKVTVTDDMGVAVEIARSRIARITRIRLQAAGAQGQ